MADGADALTAAVDAARAGDLNRLRDLVDWPLSGAGQISQSLPGVLERDRADVAASGLAELDSAATDPVVVDEILRPLAERLARAQEIRPADARASASALAILRVPAPPAGLTDAQRERLTDLSERAAALRDVYLVVDDRGEVPLAVTADSGRLVLVLD
ncbi:MAG TPA: hypothetical protein VGJ07_04920 [Rugosimonospora sp.]|jgi:hypothetical protein